MRVVLNRNSSALFSVHYSAVAAPVLGGRPTDLDGVTLTDAEKKALNRALAVYVLRQAGSATRHVRVGAYLSGFGGGPDSLCKFQEMEVCDVP